MATSDILSIWNRAVLDIGARASIAALTEASAEAAACALRYPAVVAAVLRAADWNCTRMTAALTDVTATFAAPDRWAYRYSYPSSCLRIWRMQTPSGVFWQWPDVMQGFEVAVDNDPGASNLPTKYIYSNQTELSAVFTQYAYDSTHGYYEALFDEDLKEAIGWALASVIAGPLTGKMDLVQSCRVEAMRSLAVARTSCANESAPNSLNTQPAESLAVRGFDPSWPYSWPGGPWPWTP